jgi:hypothetical protein
LIRGLFINTAKAVCSIHESGLMVYKCIIDSEKYTLDYIELDKNNLKLPSDYNFYLFNYHFITTSWLDTKSIRKLPGLKGTVILEMLPNDPFVYCSPFDFDFYCVLDPSMSFRHPKVFPFPRPLDQYDGPLSEQNNKIPVIGSFGFATKGKGFDDVVKAVNKEFEQAIIKINIPYGTYTDLSHKYAVEIATKCRSLAKKGIEVKITHDFMSKDQLIYWCSENTINCFLYDRKMPGLAAATDQAITSERPLAVSDNSTFRHIIKYLEPYPKMSLKSSVETSGQIIKRIKEDWSMENFRGLFEIMLVQLSIKKVRQRSVKKEIELSILKKNPLRNILRKYSLKIVRLYYKSFLYEAIH